MIVNGTTTIDRLFGTRVDVCMALVSTPPKGAVAPTNNAEMKAAQGKRTTKWQAALLVQAGSAGTGRHALISTTAPNHHAAPTALAQTLVHSHSPVHVTQGTRCPFLREAARAKRSVFASLTRMDAYNRSPASRTRSAPVRAQLGRATAAVAWECSIATSPDWSVNSRRHGMSVMSRLSPTNVTMP